MFKRMLTQIQKISMNGAHKKHHQQLQEKNEFSRKIRVFLQFHSSEFTWPMVYWNETIYWFMVDGVIWFPFDIRPNPEQA